VASVFLHDCKADLPERFARLLVGRLEQIERLEQLRVLKNGYDIAVGVTHDPAIGVALPGDVEKFEAVPGWEKSASARKSTVE
jgi:3-deoxy-manno-octulosonate cytidylyltransferase (CMP-KDO synthetase)